jgi:hypothetical protein
VAQDEEMISRIEVIAASEPIAATPIIGLDRKRP